MTLEIIGRQAPEGTYNLLCEVSEEGSFCHVFSVADNGHSGFSRRIDVFQWPLEPNGHEPSAVLHITDLGEGFRRYIGIVVNSEGVIIQACGKEYPRSDEHLFEPNPPVMLEKLRVVIAQNAK